MENKINVAELLKDCPKGMELDCTICNNVVTLEGVDTVGYYPIRVMSKDGHHHILTHEGCIYKREDAKCVIFPKGKTTWEGFHRPFEDGDILVHTQNQRLITSIYHNRVTELIIGTHCILWDKNDGLTVNVQICCYPDDTRFATEKEKQKLFQAIKDNGYYWNAETKTLEKLPEPIPEPKFKIGDKVIHSERSGKKLTINGVYKTLYGVEESKNKICIREYLKERNIPETSLEANSIQEGYNLAIERVCQFLDSELYTSYDFFGNVEISSKETICKEDFIKRLRKELL